MMTAGLHNECESDRKVAANIGIVFAAVYCVLMPTRIPPPEKHC